MENTSWQNRVQKFNELVALIGDFSSYEEVGEYKQFIGNCVQTLQGMMHMTLEKIANKDKSIMTCPSEFVCPISKKVMKDPVVASSGQTYDRESIEKLKDKNICPVTMLEINTTLTENVLLKEMIMAWSCKNSGGRIEFSDNEVPTQVEKRKIAVFLENINSTNSSDRRRAALMLRALTHFNKSQCLHLAYPISISTIVKALLGKEHNEEEFEEDLLYTVYHITLHEPDRSGLGENTMLIMFLIKGLEPGKSGRTRSICASTLLKLSYNKSNQENIGQSGAVKAFLGALKRRDPLIQTDAAKCLLNLCETPKNIETSIMEGGVELLYERISSEEVVVEVFKILVKITEHAVGCIRWRNSKGIHLLISIMKADNCARETKLDFLDCLINLCVLDPNSRNDMRVDDDLVAFILELGKSNQLHDVKVKSRELMRKINRTSFI